MLRSKLTAVCLGGPLAGQEIPVEGTNAVVMGDYSGRYEWVPIWHTYPGPPHITTVFAVWHPGGRRAPQ